MRVFISWSGKQSQQIALALKEWLPSVIQALDPWVSSADIDKGEGWFSSIADSLVHSNGMGIFCLTPDNVQAPWMAFEAGALAVHDRGRVATFLHGVRADGIKPPLGLFQATNSADRSDVYRLLETLNKRLPQPLPESRLKKAFEGTWESLEKDLAQIRDGATKKIAEPDQKDLLHEILATVRRIEKDANRRPGGDDSQSGSEGVAPSGPMAPRGPTSGGLLGSGLRPSEFSSTSLQRYSISPDTLDQLRSSFASSDHAVRDAMRTLREVDLNSDQIKKLRDLVQTDDAQVKKVAKELAEMSLQLKKLGFLPSKNLKANASESGNQRAGDESGTSDKRKKS